MDQFNIALFYFHLTLLFVTYCSSFLSLCLLITLPFLNALSCDVSFNSFSHLCFLNFSSHIDFFQHIFIPYPVNPSDLQHACSIISQTLYICFFFCHSYCPSFIHVQCYTWYKSFKQNILIFEFIFPIAGAIPFLFRSYFFYSKIP